MPVSRKRKKTRKSGHKHPPQSFGSRAVPGNDLAAAFAGLSERRRRLDGRRAALAAAAAKPMVAELVGLAATRTDTELGDELCARLGRTLAELDKAPTDDHVGPNALAEAVVDAAVAAASTTLSANTENTTLDGNAESRQDAWRVLTAVAATLNGRLRERAMESIDDLRTKHGRQVLPETPAGPAVTGPVLWTRDAYGSRFGVVAPFRAGDGQDRWYLWDIDACGHEAFTVHSRYHASAGEALADWQSGVGAPAADGTAFSAVDDPALLDDILPRELGVMRPGGESVEQFAEYHRGKRLAEAVSEVLERATAPRPTPPADLDRASATVHFAAWLRRHRPDRAQPADGDEHLTELADSWHIDGPAGLYHTCSPHRVALVADHIRNYYDDDFAADLVALLPDWTAWLAEHNATPAHLADRCSPYAHGAPHKGIAADDGGLSYLCRITE
ncbi:hypothetical protein [Phytohabitans suffuscus]|nr:hypothetical protein [Phytohabitans suffuscus]